MRHSLRAFRDRIRSVFLTREQRRHQLVGPPGLWKMKREFQIRFLMDAGLKPDHRLLDIGCGTLRGGIPLIEYLEPGNYFGVEVRHTVLNEARQALRETRLDSRSPTLLHVPDIALLDIGTKFDFVWAFSVLIHMTDETLHDALGAVRRHLLDTGSFFANVNTLPPRKEATWQGFPVVSRTVEFYQRACMAHGLTATDVGALGELGHTSNVAAQDGQRMLRIVMGDRGMPA